MKVLKFNKDVNKRLVPLFSLAFPLCMVLILSGCSDNKNSSNDTVTRIEQLQNGREAFRFETFGDEGFWTDAVKLPQGIVAARLTPVEPTPLSELL